MKNSARGKPIRSTSARVTSTPLNGITMSASSPSVRRCRARRRRRAPPGCRPGAGSGRPAGRGRPRRRRAVPRSRGRSRVRSRSRQSGSGRPSSSISQTRSAPTLDRPAPARRGSRRRRRGCSRACGAAPAASPRHRPAVAQRADAWDGHRSSCDASWTRVEASQSPVPSREALSMTQHLVELRDAAPAARRSRRPGQPVLRDDDGDDPLVAVGAHLLSLGRRTRCRPRWPSRTLATGQRPRRLSRSSESSAWLAAYPSERLPTEPPVTGRARCLLRLDGGSAGAPDAPLVDGSAVPGSAGAGAAWASSAAGVRLRRGDRLGNHLRGPARCPAPAVMIAGGTRETCRDLLVLAPSAPGP